MEMTTFHRLFAALSPFVCFGWALFTQAKIVTPLGSVLKKLIQAIKIAQAIIPHCSTQGTFGLLLGSTRLGLALLLLPLGLQQVAWSKHPGNRMPPLTKAPRFLRDSSIALAIHEGH